jgi:hypothetical protein
VAAPSPRPGSFLPDFPSYSGDLFVSHTPRILVGCAALAACLGALTTATADSPEVPKDSYKKTADTDLKFLQDRLAELVKKDAAGTKPTDGQVKPAIGIALALSAYGDALGDSALKADAIKVAEALAKKDFKGAEGLAKKLAVKPGTPGKPGELPKPFKDDMMLESAMSPFRGSSVGGLNIDKDIKDMTKSTNAAKIEPASVELLAVRSSVLSAYGLHSPNEKAKVNATKQALWNKLSTESTDVSKQIVAEASKGKAADEKKLKGLLNKLNGQCTKCHEEFRDE